VRLTELGEGTEDTRRRANIQNNVRAVLHQLADARLITLGDDTAEVAHEALKLHRNLSDAARDWELIAARVWRKRANGGNPN
jgi:hypothetical protein